MISASSAPRLVSPAALVTGACLALTMPVVAAQEATHATLRAVERDVRTLLPRASAATVGIDGNGSGVIVTPDGYVLTAHHVAPKDDATVTLHLGDGRKVEAQVLGGDKPRDARILKLVGTGPWPFVPMADDDRQVAPGDWVVGLGHAGGHVADRPPQVRVGRIQRVGDGGLSTDCAMGPGDSGGPLLDRGGRVIGVHRSADSRRTDHAPITVYRGTWDEWTARGARGMSRGEAVSAFGEAANRVARSVVRLRVGGKPAALGTVVSRDGLVVSKWSELRGRVTVDAPGGRSVDVKEVGRSHAHDVVLLRVDPDGLGVEPLAWPSTSATSAGGGVPGAFVAIVSPVGQPPSGVGVISVGVRPVPDVALQMGMEFEEVGPGGVRIVRITPGSVAANSSLRVGDVFTHINDKAIGTRDDLFAELSRSGRQNVKIVIRRGDGLAKTEFPVHAPGRHATDDRVNRRRHGFPACLQHDADLQPEDCGGPLIDIDGTIIGINIARSSHSAALAIPAQAMRQLIQELRPDGS